MPTVSKRVTVICPECGKDMWLDDDGYYYCADYLISEVNPGAADCFGHLTWWDGQEQWKRRVKADRAKFKEWLTWAMA